MEDSYVTYKGSEEHCDDKQEDIMLSGRTNIPDKSTTKTDCDINIDRHDEFNDAFADTDSQERRTGLLTLRSPPTGRGRGAFGGGALPLDNSIGTPGGAMGYFSRIQSKASNFCNAASKLDRQTNNYSENYCRDRIDYRRQPFDDRHTTDYHTPTTRYNGPNQTAVSQHRPSGLCNGSQPLRRVTEYPTDEMTETYINKDFTRQKTVADINMMPNSYAADNFNNSNIVRSDVGRVVDSGSDFKPRPTLKLCSFDGTGPLETFLAKFNNCSEYYNWSARDRLFHLRACLDKSAANVLWDADPQNTVEDLINLLRNRFGNQNQAERYRAELRCRRRRKGEPLQSLYQDVRRLMALAYPSQSGSLSELVARDAFLESLGDPAMRIRILEREPTSLDEALKVACRLEALSIDADTTEHTFDSQGRRKDGFARSASAPRELDFRVEQLEESLKRERERSRRDAEEQRKHNEQARQDLERMKNEVEIWRQRARVQQPLESQNTGFNRDNRGESDNPRFPGRNVHFTPNRPSSFERDIVCSICRQSGHSRFACPNSHTRPNNANHNKSNRGGRMQANSANFYLGGAETYIAVKIKGVKTMCLLDTGCDHSICPRGLVPNVVLQPANVDVWAANGTKIPIEGKTKLNFCVSGMQCGADILVSDDVQEVMLGFDWLKKQGAHWLFDQGVLLLNGCKIPLRSRPSQAGVRRVMVREQTIIEPDCETNVPVKMLHASLRTPEADWLVESRTLAKHIFLARVLLPNDDSAAAVRVVNLSGKSFVLNRGLKIGHAEAASVERFKAVVNSNAGATCNMINVTAKTGTADSAAQDEPSHLKPLFDTLPTDMCDRERAEAILFIMQNADVFSRHEFDLGLTNLMEHRIDTGEARPVRQGLRRHPQVHLEVIDRQVDLMAQGGIIENACSPWASNVVVVTKRDSTPRITLDYRQLNLLTYKDCYPLPNIADCLDALGGSTCFSVLDLRSGFYQVPLADADRDKTAFITRRGQFRFKVLPMGLCNSPGTFQRLMDLVMRGLAWSSVLVYIDDIVVYSKSFNEQLIRLTEVFKRLRAANLKLKPTKCRLFQDEISFLGHRISKEGVAMDPEKVKAIVEWPAPTSVKEVRTFLGLCGYYRRYIKGYAEIAGPLHELTRKDESYTWNNRRQEAFDKLRLKLTTAPILGMSCDHGQYVLDVDASDRAAGAVLQQEQDGQLRVIGYASHSFDRCQRNYCATRREMAALVFGLKHYKQFLLGRKFIVRVDCAALAYVRTAGELIGQQARWIDLLEQFDCEFEHRAGLTHGNADALSRRPCETEGACRQCRRLPRKSGKGQTAGFETNKSGDNGGREMLQALSVKTRAQSRLQARTRPLSFSINNADWVAVQDDADSVQEARPDPTHVSKHTKTQPRQRGNRRHKAWRREINQHIDDEWNPEFLNKQQELDPDLKILRQWYLVDQERPSWDVARSSSPALKAYWQQWKSLEVRDNVLYRVLESADGQTLYYQLLLPRNLRNIFLDRLHSGIAGHLGRFKTREHVSKRAYWFQWRRDSDMFVARCHTCNRYHKGKPPRHGLLRPMILGAPAERWAIDLTGPHPKSSSGHMYILTAVDAFSKFAILVALRDKTAVTVADVILEHVFLRFGAGEILTDGGTEFRNELLNELTRMLGVSKVMTSAYRPETDGLAERYHLTLNSMLAKVISKGQRDWDCHLAHVAFFYNASVHEATKQSPFFIMHGMEARWDIDIVLNNPNKEHRTPNDYAALLVERMEAAHDLVRESLGVSASRMKNWYDRKTHKMIFESGDKVFVLDLRRYPGRYAKWSCRYNQVATVVRRINDVTYVVRVGNKSKILHVDKLKPYLSTEGGDD